MAARTVAEPFFLHTDQGKRFCMYRAPSDEATLRGAYLHVPAFGEEMNKARRMTALQARKLAECGIASMHVDLFGTGDSDGDFSEAHWEAWLDDVEVAANWLAARTGTSVGLWGLRLGGMLAAQSASEGRVRAKSLVLWQPVTSGQMFLTQFLRLRVANAMLSGDPSAIDTRRLREALTAGESLEIGGYELSPTLAAQLDRLRLEAFPTKGLPCAWFDVCAGAELSPATRKVVTSWQSADMPVTAAGVSGELFWSSVEITESAELLLRTSAFCCGLQ